MQIARIEQELTRAGMGRRAFLGTAAAVAAAASLVAKPALAGPAAKNLAASPPAGFSPFSAPGKVVKVTKKDCLQANQLYPKPDAAKEMLTQRADRAHGQAGPRHGGAAVRPQGRHRLREGQRHWRSEGGHHGLQQGARGRDRQSASSPQASPPANIWVFEQYPSIPRRHARHGEQRSCQAGVKAFFTRTTARTPS